MKRAWLENTDRFISAHWQPAVLFELAQQKQIDKHVFLKGSRIFPEDFLKTNTYISAEQYFQLISNVKQTCPHTSLAFLYGERLLPGFCPELINALSHCSNLYQTLETLTNYPFLIFPTVKLSLVKEDNNYGLELHDAFGLGDNFIFAAEAVLSGFCSWVKWQSKLNLPLRFEFSYPKPTYFEEYELHLGDNVDSGKYMFNSVRCRVTVDQASVFREWPKGSTRAFELAQAQLASRINNKQQGFCDKVEEVVLENIAENICLQRTAEIFDTSASSLKRKLKQHNTSFQKILDSCRAKKAVELMQQKNLSTDEVSEALNILDTSNFRRSFKRWTGYTPRAYRQNFHLV